VGLTAIIKNVYHVTFNKIRCHARFAKNGLKLIYLQKKMKITINNVKLMQRLLVLPRLLASEAATAAETAPEEAPATEEAPSAPAPAPEDYNAA
jgi:hypothetical protein